MSTKLKKKNKNRNQQQESTIQELLLPANPIGLGTLPPGMNHEGLPGGKHLNCPLCGGCRLHSCSQESPRPRTNDGKSLLCQECYVDAATQKGQCPECEANTMNLCQICFCRLCGFPPAETMENFDLAVLRGDACYADEWDFEVDEVRSDAEYIAELVELASSQPEWTEADLMAKAVGEVKESNRKLYEECFQDDLKLALDGCALVQSETGVISLPQVAA